MKQIFKSFNSQKRSCFFSSPVSPRYLYSVYFCSVVHFSGLPYTRNLCFGLFQSHGFILFLFQLHLNILTKRQLVAEKAWSLTCPQSSLLRKERSARGWFEGGKGRDDWQIPSPFLLPITPRTSLLSQERRLGKSQAWSYMRPRLSSSTHHTESEFPLSSNLTSLSGYHLLV